MDNFKILSAEVEEGPHYFEFTKSDFIGDCVGMTKLNYDPFPDKPAAEVVRTEIIARKLVLRAKLEGSVFDMRPGVMVDYEGRSFTVTKSQVEIHSEADTSTAEIEAEAFLSPPNPSKALAALRAALAVK